MYGSMRSRESSSSTENSNNFADLGIPTNPDVQTNPLGQVRTFRSISVREWIYLVLTASGILASAGFAIYFMVTNAGKNTSDFTLALLILFNSGFMMFYLIDGIFTEKAFELLLLVGTTVVITIYLIANFISTGGWENPIKIARLSVAAVVAPFSVCLGLMILFNYFTSGNFIFRKVGADTHLQKLCKRLFFTECVMRFDLQSTLSVVLLVVNADSDGLSIVQILIVSIGVPYAILWMIMILVTLRLEHLIMLIVVSVLGLLQPTYMIVSMVDNVNGLKNLTTIIPDRADFSTYSVPAITFGTCTLALINRIILYALLYLVAKNFGQGLRDKVLPPLLKKRKSNDRQALRT